MRVTMLALENRSMLAKEKDCTLWNMSWRRFREKPAMALAAYLPERVPKVRLRMHITASSAPILPIMPMFPTSMPLSMSTAISMGMNTSITTSKET